MSSMQGVIALVDQAATEALGRRLAAELAPGDVVALDGDLGAGKTTLARGILQGLGYEGDVASPTFPIVLTYAPPETRVPVWHVDLYRIEAPEELEELGIEEAQPEVVLLIEWPERFPALWAQTLRLRLDRPREGGRALTAWVPPAWGDRWPPR
jgi:tRNA threonylcarbamoyladenosine biosynthesis protein TsaE